MTKHALFDLSGRGRNDCCGHRRDGISPAHDDKIPPTGKMSRSFYGCCSVPISVSYGPILSQYPLVRVIFCSNIR